MTKAEREELIEWLAWQFEALASGSVWPDLTPRSKGNVFDWRGGRAS